MGEHKFKIAGFEGELIRGLVLKRSKRNNDFEQRINTLI